MKLRRRAMQPEDIAECVDIVANHPTLGPRYGSAIEDLSEAWRRLLRCAAHFAQVVQRGDGERAPICCFGVSAIMRDDFLDDENAAAFLGRLGIASE